MARNGASLDDAAGGHRPLGHRVLATRTYWVAHLNHHGKGATGFSRDIREAIRSLAEGDAWEMPAFYVFESYATIDHIALILRAQRRIKDVFLIGSFTHAQCRIVGPCEDARIRELVPFARRTGQMPQPFPDRFRNLAAARRAIIAEIARAHLGELAEGHGSETDDPARPATAEGRLAGRRREITTG